MPGCKERQPVPTHYADLGEDGRPLVPTSAPVHNARIEKGSADWQPFRQPEIPDENAPASPTRAGATSDDAGSNSESEKKAIRETIADYNEALATGTTEDLLEFFTDDQSKIAETVLPTLDALNLKLGELATAVPDQSKVIETLRAELAAVRLLKIEIASIETRGHNAATVTLKQPPLPSFLPNLSEEAKTASTVSFSLGEDEYWYLQSPILAALTKVQPVLEQMVTEADGVVASKNNADASKALAATKTLFPALDQVKAVLSKVNGGHNGD